MYNSIVIKFLLNFNEGFVKNTTKIFNKTDRRNTMDNYGRSLIGILIAFGVTYGASIIGMVITFVLYVIIYKFNKTRFIPFCDRFSQIATLLFLISGIILLILAIAGIPYVITLFMGWIKSIRV